MKLLNIPKEKLKLFVDTSKNIEEVLLKLDIPNTSGNYSRLLVILDNFSIDYSNIFNKRRSIVRNNFLSIQTNIELFKENSIAYPTLVKSRILKENLKVYECEICKIKQWENKKLVLQLDHINGIKTDNRLENLRWLCPNCHSQTDTFCRSKKYNKNLTKCICGNTKSHKAKSCIDCYKCPEKIVWPSDEILKEMVGKYSLLQLSKQLNVSDVAIKKRCKKLKISIKRIKDIVHGTRSGYLKEARQKINHCTECTLANTIYSKKLAGVSAIVPTDLKP